ncbi:MAG: phosphatidate cytidylyltransferase [Geminicoccaceae bacterium]
MADDGPAFRLRLLSALVLAPIALGVVAAGGWIFAVFVGVMTALMAHEWSRLSEARFGDDYARAAGAVVLGVGLAAILLTLLNRPGAALGCVAAAALAAGLIAWARGSAPLWTGIGIVLVGLPAVALIWLRSLPDIGLSTLLWLLIVVWTTDSAAYLVGRRVGGARLAPSISPGKTWSGLGGGVIGASLASVIMAWALGSERLVHAAGLGAGFAVIAQLGDLAESMLKRRAGVKDSGRLIPGHGGVLDRMDGFLLTAPALALLLGLKLWPWP